MIASEGIKFILNGSELAYISFGIAKFYNEEMDVTIKSFLRENGKVIIEDGFPKQIVQSYKIAKFEIEEFANKLIVYII